MLNLKLTFVFVFGTAIVNGVFGKSVNDAQSKYIPAIIGGDEVDIRQYPHQVAIFLMGYGHWCGGSIISKEYVLTAAHCVMMDDYPGNYQLKVGSTYLNKDGVLYNISSIIKHPNFLGDILGSLDYDIAVLKVSGKIAIDDESTKIVRIAESGNALKAGDFVTVTGWGDTEANVVNSKSSEVLQAVTLPVVDQNHCIKVWKEWDSPQNITERMLCAGFKKPGKTACHGDSGGPVIDANNNVQYGIVSFGDQMCKAKDLPNVFTFIPALRDWIKQTTGV